MFVPELMVALGIVECGAHTVQSYPQAPAVSSEMLWNGLACCEAALLLSGQGNGKSVQARVWLCPAD